MLLMLFGIYLHQYAQCNLFFIQHDDDQNDGLRAQNQPASMAQNPDLSVGVIFFFFFANIQPAIEPSIDQIYCLKVINKRKMKKTV